MVPSSYKPLPFRIRAQLFTQLAQMEIAGLPFDRAFSVLKLPKIAADRLEVMQQLVAKAKDPAFAGEKSGLFTKLEASLVRAALNAGSPGNMYRRLGDYYTERAMQVATMKSRLWMPAGVLLLAVFIKPLPLLIGGSVGAVGYLWQAVRPLLLVAAIVYGVRWLTSGDARSTGKSIYQSLPLYGSVFVRRNLRDFFESLALMLEAGISMLDALPAALETVEDGDMRRELAKIRQRVEKGAPLADALRGTAYIVDERVIQFTQTGEASGTLPEMLLRHCAIETQAINSYYEQLAAWVPRVIYALVAAWMAYGILTGGGIMTRIPADL